jgi:hypothetical protein
MKFGWSSAAAIGASILLIFCVERLGGALITDAKEYLSRDRPSRKPTGARTQTSVVDSVPDPSAKEHESVKADRWRESEKARRREKNEKALQLLKSKSKSEPEEATQNVR